MPITPLAKSRQNKNVKVCGAVKIRKLRGISEGVNARYKKDAETQNRKKTGWGFGRVMYSKRSSENFSDDLLLYLPHRLMQMLVNGFRQCLADAFDLFQIFFTGGNDAAQASEAGEQGLATFAAYAGDVAEG